MSTDFEKVGVDFPRVGVDGETNLSLLDEVHLSNLLIFFVYDLVHGIVTVESPGEESERKLADKLFVLHDILREKSIELVKYIGEHVITHDILNNLGRQIFELLILLKKICSIITPEMLLIFCDVINERNSERLPGVESFKRDQPDVEIRHLIRVAHFLIIVRYDLYKVAHNKREKSYPTQHNNNC